MKTSRTYIALLIAVIVLGAGSYFTERSFLASSPSSDNSHSTAINTQTFTATSSATQSSDVTFIISGASYGLYVPAGATVLDAMRILASTTNFTFSGRDYPGLGIFVESINGKANADNFYWTLYVNGVSSTQGASQAKISPGDVVVWRYEKNH
ncbi:MAG: DUF4430 domain-containing protein [Patescibacteria group bacterium]|nr:DUF4430 domain-containing protein [Patescibacteria group bacterium]